MKFPENARLDGITGGNGVFCFLLNKELGCYIIASKGGGWEHVSVTMVKIRKNKIVGGIPRCPTWEEMCHVKGLFFDDEETVMQLHPPKSEWVSTHPYCLHLWKPLDSEIPRPPQILVGWPGDNVQS